MQTLCLACSQISVRDAWTAAALGLGTGMKHMLSQWMHMYKCTFKAIEATMRETHSGEDCAVVLGAPFRLFIINTEGLCAEKDT